MGPYPDLVQKMRLLKYVKITSLAINEDLITFWIK